MRLWVETPCIPAKRFRLVTSLAEIYPKALMSGFEAKPDQLRNGVETVSQQSACAGALLRLM
jgi:hypothetical protein